tara:strand:- start:2461 stop:2991 length:531 start_codon:yes stop_codon:yes gene_type:complete
MLGLGSSLITSEGVSSLPPISDLSSPSSGTPSWLVSTTDAGGSGSTLESNSTTTLGDLRISILTGSIVGSASEYKVAGIRIENQTSGSGEVAILSSSDTPLVIDSVRTVFSGVVSYFFDASSVMDNLDFGSSSSYSFKHSGSGTNRFNFNIDLSHDQYEGIKTLPLGNQDLTDSDA